MNKICIKRIFRLLLVIFIMGIIFHFSNQNASSSSEVSDGLIIRIAEFIGNKKLSNEEKEDLIEELVTPVRKSAHFAIYLVLGITVINYCITYNMKIKYLIIISILICFLYSCSDEIHQLFIIGRSGEIRDIFIDTIGSIVGILLYMFIYNNKILNISDFKKKHI